MSGPAPSSGLTFPVCSRSPPALSFSSPLAMRCGGGRVDGDGDCKKAPAPGVHPRYVPVRGAVLKGIIRGMLSYFILISPVKSRGRRVRPGPPGAGGDGVEQGKK